MNARKFYWGEVFTATYIINTTPSRTLAFKIPKQGLLFPNINLLSILPSSCLGVMSMSMYSPS